MENAVGPGTGVLTIFPTLVSGSAEGR